MQILSLAFLNIVSSQFSAFAGSERNMRPKSNEPKKMQAFAAHTTFTNHTKGQLARLLPRHN
jgi:hypothetical protein